MPVLSDEQELFVRKALEGSNLLCDACIGSGKTTAIQALCNRLDASKRVLYLTYNRLLKIDAQNKINAPHTFVTNYHGFAGTYISRAGVSCGKSDVIQAFNRVHPRLDRYDVLIMDEYQDIEQEMADMLLYIKECNPGIQIIAVGDMDQKIYDKTTLNVPSFMHRFLGEHFPMEFTKCFRLSADIAASLGRVWNKTIIGVNDTCKVGRMNKYEALKLLARLDPKDVLCLGARTGIMADTLNMLESRFPDRYNKQTVYASIRDNDSGGSTRPTEDSAIFTTFDSSKGLERKVCIIFDYTLDYWYTRVNQPDADYTIIRNIFLVAASRGKEMIVFVEPASSDSIPLTWNDISTPPVNQKSEFRDLDMSDMFSFRYKEDVEDCYSLIKVKKLRPAGDVIDIPDHDGLIDLSPCIGIYQEAMFFKGYDIDKEIEMFFANHDDKDFLRCDTDGWGLPKKILYLMMLETGQRRYSEQVELSFANETAAEEITKRLSAVFTYDEDVQRQCSLAFSKCYQGKTALEARGIADVVKDDTVYELKFISGVTHEHLLQCASYMVALGLKKGVLWNIKDGEMLGITIPDRRAFMDAVARTITKGRLTSYHLPIGEAPLPLMPAEETDTQDVPGKPVKRKKEEACGGSSLAAELEKEELKRAVEKEPAPVVNILHPVNVEVPRVAVIDTETNWKNDIMSIGMIIMDMPTPTTPARPQSGFYGVINPAYTMGGAFSNKLFYGKMYDSKPKRIFTRAQAIKRMEALMTEHHVTTILAYNATFDKSHLPELEGYTWCDIMKIAAYKQYNPIIEKLKIPCSKSGRIKAGYGVEPMLQMLSGDRSYREIHNAYYDAYDECRIVGYLAKELSVYIDHAKV